ncbi:glycosyltransferase [Psychromarinibacter sp. S121]|uniref:glycosyltransferase n=1 Tax=Psychromarinibacter sp. S121 TaxID=3415127 RepID=UPI003C7D6FFF
MGLRSVPGGRDLPHRPTASGHSAPQHSGQPRPRLGQILVDAGALSPAVRDAALARQARVDARLGDILMADGAIDRPLLHASLARQFGADLANLAAQPPDPVLVAMLGADTCLSLGLLPWRRSGGAVDIASARPEAFERHRPRLERLFGPVRMAVTGDLEIHDAIWRLRPAELVSRAETRVPAAESCRTMAFSPARAHPLALAAAFLCLVLVFFHPMPALRFLTFWAIVTLLANSLLKGAALARHLVRTRTAPPEAEMPIVARKPRISLLVPLFRERRIAGRLIARLDRLDYPRELLDILLVVEADDAVTRETLAGLDMPPHMRCVTVPGGSIKTKPRALNYALDFCRGSIVGVYDAEDAPDPDQLNQVVRRFHRRGPDLACVQATLDFYNSRSNWLARCFAVEYAAWFRVVLPGLTGLGLVAPLGGTSLFFRRAVLEELGGWDAHNVTEDADLGVRLARHGYRTEFIGSVTSEEANCRALPWIRQRSRWLKGYMMTWAVHMRRPLKLLKQLGPRRFLGFQMLFLGTISQFLLAPFLWLFWLLPFGMQHPFAPAFGPAIMVGLLTAFLLSEAISIAVGLVAVRGPEHRHLMPWVLTLHFYFPLAALAAYKGLFELLTWPFYWDKTEHGIYPETEPDASAVPRVAKGEGEPAAVTRRRRRA